MFTIDTERGDIFIGKANISIERRMDWTAFYARILEKMVWVLPLREMDTIWTITQQLLKLNAFC